MKNIFYSSKKAFVLLLLTWSGLITVHAQQDAQYTQYMYNTININPAYAGSREALSVFGLHRTQWVGLDGAPVTNTISINSPISNSNLGIGLSIVNDRIGPSDENTFSADVSYTIKTSETFKLSFGLKATGNLLNVDYNRLNRHNVADGNFETNISNRFSPNIGAGVYFHSENAYLGLSVPNFLETDHFDDNQYATAKEKMHYYFIGGYVFDLNPNLKFKPAFLSKAVVGSPLQVDVTANFMFHEKFILGAAWRWDAALSAIAGFQINDRWFIGYSYDAETTKLANYNSGSHEIFLRFEIFQNLERIVSPRFF